MHNLPVEVLSEIFALVANTPPVPPVAPPSQGLDSWPTHRSQADLRVCAEVCSFWRKVAVRFQYAHVTVCSTRQLAMLRATLGVVPGRAKLVRVFARLFDLCGLCPDLRGLGVNDPAFWWRTEELVGQANFTLAVNPPLSGPPEGFCQWGGNPFKLLLTGNRERITHLHVGHAIRHVDCCGISKYPLSKAFDEPFPNLHTISLQQTDQQSRYNLCTLLPKVVAMSFQIPNHVAVRSLADLPLSVKSLVLRVLRIRARKTLPGQESLFEYGTRMINAAIEFLQLFPFRGNLRLVVCLEDERDREAWALNALQSTLDQRIRKHRTYRNLKIECIPLPAVEQSDILWADELHTLDKHFFYGKYMH
ncbi:hypothetical protein HDU90_004206 [Geranomyces variabilis]|nr:hypothetical protein HDU90_004206 [Geranomyces variabilis]